MIRLAFLLLVWAAAPAYAHGALPGAGGFYAGTAHPFVSIDHLLLLIALGLVLSQHDLRVGLGVLVAGTSLGLAFPLLNLRIDAAAFVLLLLAIIAGASLAAARSLPAAAALILCAVGGSSIGLQTDLPMGDPTLAATAGAGVVLAVFLIAAYAMAIGTLARGRLAGLPLRIAGSWIIAAAVLMGAFALRGTTGVGT